MTNICIPPHRLEAMLTEISLHRALTEQETDLLEAVITRGHTASGVRLRWTPHLERALMRTYDRPSAIREFAKRHGITEKAAYDKRAKLRKARELRQVRKAQSKQVTASGKAGA